MVDKKRKAFSLVELVVVLVIIAILAASVFSGGASALGKSRVSRVKSDLHNFEVWIQTSLTENGFVSNIQDNKMSGQNSMKTIVDILNDYLPADYKMVNAADPLTSTTVDNIRIIADTTDTGSYVIFESKKHDAWDNPYFLIFDCTDREYGAAEFYITVASAGPNGQATIGGNVDTDDIFCIGQSHNNGVFVTTYDCSEIESFSTGTQTLRFAGYGADEDSAVKYVSYNGTTARVQTTKRSSSPTENSGSSTPVVTNHGENHDDDRTWTSVTTLSEMTQDGNYVLASNITSSSDWTVAKNITVCLNGHSITLTNGKNIIVNGGNLTLENCSGVASISRIVVANGVCTVATGANIHITGSAAEGSYPDASGNGGCVYVGDGGSFSMNGGSITGGVAFGNGGGVYVANGGSFTLANGSVTGNRSTNGNGGGIANDGGLINIGSDGYLTSNTAENGQGANIYSSVPIGGEGATSVSDVVITETP